MDRMGEALDELVAAVADLAPPEKSQAVERLTAALGTFVAEAINRTVGTTVATVVTVDTKLDRLVARVETLERAVGAD